MGRIVTGVARADLSGRDYTPSAKVNAGFMEAPDLRVEGKKVPSPSQLLINELMKSTDMESGCMTRPRSAKGVNHEQGQHF
jgi:hypothetical protein